MIIRNDEDVKNIRHRSYGLFLRRKIIKSQYSLVNHLRTPEVN